MDTENARKYLIEVLHKELINSDECDNSGPVNGGPWGYRKLAKKYWPDAFKTNKRIEVHHIDGDRTNNKVSNLVPLTVDEHRLIHALFDENHIKQNEHISESMKGHSVTIECKRKMSVAALSRSPKTRKRRSDAMKEHWRKRKNSNCAH